MLSGGAIAGIVIGCLLAVVVLGKFVGRSRHLLFGKAMYAEANNGVSDCQRLSKRVALNEFSSLT